MKKTFYKGYAGHRCVEIEYDTREDINTLLEENYGLHDAEIYELRVGLEHISLSLELRSLTKARTKSYFKIELYGCKLEKCPFSFSTDCRWIDNITIEYGEYMTVTFERTDVKVCCEKMVIVTNSIVDVEKDAKKL